MRLHVVTQPFNSMLGIRKFPTIPLVVNTTKVVNQTLFSITKQPKFHRETFPLPKIEGHESEIY